MILQLVSASLHSSPYIIPKTSKNRSETPPNAIKTQDIHTTKKVS